MGRADLCHKGHGEHSVGCQVPRAMGDGKPHGSALPMFGQGKRREAAQTDRPRPRHALRQKARGHIGHRRIGDGAIGPLQLLTPLSKGPHAGEVVFAFRDVHQHGCRHGGHGQGGVPRRRSMPQRPQCRNVARRDDVVDPSIAFRHFFFFFCTTRANFLSLRPLSLLWAGRLGKSACGCGSFFPSLAKRWAFVDYFLCGCVAGCVRFLLGMVSSFFLLCPCNISLVCKKKKITPQGQS